MMVDIRQGDITFGPLAELETFPERSFREIGIVVFSKRPPTANQLYVFIKTASRRVPSKAYRRWRQKCAVVRVHHTWTRPYDTPVTGRIAVHYIVARRRINARQDLGNMEKPLSDQLVLARIIEDDSQIFDLRMSWSTVDLEFPVVARIWSEE